MKILVISDTHGNDKNLLEVLEQEKKPDCLLHLGDYAGQDREISNLVDCPSYFVTGNCDFFSDHPVIRILDFHGCSIFMTHGHYHYVNAGTKELVKDAKARNCRIALFGHTHRPYYNEEDPDITVINPGSLSLPRQEGKCASYSWLTIKEDGSFQCDIRYL